MSQEKAFKDISYPSNIFGKVRGLKSGEFHLEIRQFLFGHNKSYGTIIPIACKRNNGI